MFVREEAAGAQPLLKSRKRSGHRSLFPLRCVDASGPVGQTNTVVSKFWIFANFGVFIVLFRGFPHFATCMLYIAWYFQNIPFAKMLVSMTDILFYHQESDLFFFLTRLKLL